ncbi:MAG TPA: 2,3,4,5-tetrahydropyridine-2,6-dicarboxylate N-succinyltransferase [Candidatus Kryptonia bacterium]
MSRDLLRIDIEKSFDSNTITPETASCVERFLEVLDIGEVRAAEPDKNSPTGWRVNEWVKKGILLAFRVGKVVRIENGYPNHFYDKSTFPTKGVSISDDIRLVPGGTSIRRGAYIDKGTVIMPPTYVNVGAHIGEGTMLDSHTLVGSCAQVGKKVHLSAASQIGGVLEPVGALPVIIEDEVMIGGNCGIYEGTLVKRRAVIGAGCIITGSTPIYDLVKRRIYKKEKTRPLIVPEGAVVVPGSRIVDSDFARKNGISIYTPVIVKYRDEKTDAATALEESLR